jgi:hypothetical protein
MMRDTTNLLKRQLQQVARRVKVTSPDRLPLDRLLSIFAGCAEPTPTERALLIDHKHEHELNYDPPDCVERRLARLIALAEGQPDPYGTAEMSEVERRAWDWADYHKTERIT